MDAELARKTWRTMEPVHGAIYFAAEPREEYAAIGLGDRMAGYFASRAAAMGPVPADVVIATFFNFDPDLVRRSMAGVWERVTPAAVSAARLRRARVSRPRAVRYEPLWAADSARASRTSARSSGSVSMR